MSSIVAKTSKLRYQELSECQREREREREKKNRGREGERERDGERNSKEKRTKEYIREFCMWKWDGL